MGPFEEYWKRLVRVCIDRQLTLVPLGKTGRQVIWMVRNDVPRNKHLLIVAGTHGEEVAGPWGVLKFLEEARDDILFKASLCILPVVSPVVFGKRRQRTTKPNCGFVREVGDCLSIEGEVLMKHLPMLIRASSDGLLNLHETIDEESFYLYLMGENFGVARDLLHIGGQFFDIIEEGTPMREPKSPKSMAWGGIVHNVRDGSLDDRLWLEGCPICITSETPGKKNIILRIEANKALIEGFIEVLG